MYFVRIELESNPVLFALNSTKQKGHHSELEILFVIGKITRDTYNFEKTKSSPVT